MYPFASFVYSPLQDLIQTDVQPQIIMKLTSKNQSYYKSNKENKTCNLSQFPSIDYPKHRDRTFNSPQTHTIQDYNSFMVQKKHPKVEYASPTRNYTSSILQHNRRPLSPQQPYKYEVLLKQNNYLIQELLKSKEKQTRYRNKIRQMKKQQPGQDCSRTYISIQDLQESKWTGSTARTLSTIHTPNTLPEENTKMLLDSSMEYIKHAGLSLATQIDIVNNRLCVLLQQASCQQDRSVKLRKRREMCQCISELKELKKLYEDAQL